MRNALTFFLLFVISLTVSAQVSFTARVVFPEPEYKSPDFIHYLMGIGFGFRLMVDSEDTVRYCICDSNAMVRFENIRRGSRCLLSYKDFWRAYDYPVFTITSDTIVDSLKLQRIRFSHDKLFWSKTEKDSTLESQAVQWSKDVDGYDTIRYDTGFLLDDEPHSLKLARLYYADWVAPITSWRTWPYAADSAYRYCLHACKRYSYLYYPLRQLAHHLGKHFEIETPKAPDKYTYFPLPTMTDMWWADTCIDLFTPWEQHTWINSYTQEHTLGLAVENSLCYPLAADGTIRLTEDNPLGGTMIYRVEGGIIHRIRVVERPVESIIIEREYYALTPDEIDSVSTVLADFQRVGRPDDESGSFAIDGSMFFLEYISDGNYHLYITSTGAVPTQLDALQKLLLRILNRRQ